MNGEKNKESEISMNVGMIKESFVETKKFFMRKDIQIIFTIILLLIIIIISSSIRLQNIDLLKDQTTGEYIPVALDPFYFLRIAETILDNNGLPSADVMRQPFAPSFSLEILPKVVVFMYKAFNVVGDASIQKVNVLSPVVFFILGLIVFFFMVYSLTNSKKISIISSLFLSLIPSYLYRTMAGFSDHESIGMLSFFIAILVITLSFKFLDKKEDKKDLRKSVLYGAITGFLIALTLASWGGISNYLLLILPFSILIYWVVNEKQKKKLSNIGSYYFSTNIFAILFGLIVFSYPLTTLMNKFLFSSSGVINLFSLGFILIDYILIKKKIKFVKEKYRIFYSICILVMLGLILMLIPGNREILIELIERSLHPFGQGRVSLTVAENAQPYLQDWISQIGKNLFWIFFVGLIILGFEFVKKIEKKSSRNGMIFFWMLMISGILFSRISSSSMMNGDNFLSKLLYFGSIFVFGIYFIIIYLRGELKIGYREIILFSFMIFMLISARSAVRVFFIMTPFTCLISGYSIVKIFDRFKKTKEDIVKIILGILFIIVIILGSISIYNSYHISSNQAKSTGPSANYQWQGAMSWVRENTPENSVFVHWWDYGYWVQYLGKRPTLSDGGQFQGDFRNHLVGRYVLTTPYPETALSFMKSNNVSYLLIDPTDLGKYGAYSRIGSDGNFVEDKGYYYDRFSSISLGNIDTSQTLETTNETVRVYPVTAGVDEDIIYTNTEGKQIFLPGPTYSQTGNPDYKSFLIGVILKTTPGDNEFKQPIGVFLYNNQQIQIPLRNIYFSGLNYDFGSGVESTVRIIPLVKQNSNGEVSIDSLGSIIYLSPKVSDSLFAQIYLMDDPFNKYNTIELVHEEQDIVISLLRSQGQLMEEDFVNYQGFRGPIKIWDVSYPEDILFNDELTKHQSEIESWDWAMFDDLEFSVQ